MNTHKITLTKSNGAKVLSRKNTGLEYPSRKEAANAVAVIQNTFSLSLANDTYDVTIEKI